MKKILSAISIGIVGLTIFVGLLAPRPTYAQTGLPPCNANDVTLVPGVTCDANATPVRVDSKINSPNDTCSFTNPQACILIIPGYIASFVILPLVGWITTLSGLILNYVVDLTVVKMADNLSTNAITDTWGTVRDVANMFFIFVLLYTAIMTMFGKANFRKTIANIVIAALLINFSLFFTKVIIDAGNLLALTFYKAIVSPGVGTTSAFDTGISNALMNQLHLASIWDSRGLLDGTKLVTIGVMGSIAALVAAFVFLAISIMFVIRFVVLIFVLILSPIMFAGLVLPGVGDYRKQWGNALINQTFFAPIYFFLMWIVIKLSQTLFTSSGSLGDALGNSYDASGKLMVTDSTFGILINFIMLIAFLILALTVAKSYSNKAGGAIASANKWALGFAGGATFGIAGRVGRNTVGRAGQAIADSRWVKSNPDSRAARLAMTAGKKIGSASFDVRATKASEHLGGAGEAGGKGGFRARREEIIKGRMQQAADFRDVITGEHVENEMTNRRWTSEADQAWLQGIGLTAAQIAQVNANGLGKNQIERLGLSARQAEDIRRRVQGDLTAASDRESIRRQNLLLNSLSQTHWYNPNLYSGVSEDAEAAKRMRSGQRNYATPQDETNAILKQNQADLAAQAQAIQALAAQLAGGAARPAGGPAAGAPGTPTP